MLQKPCYAPGDVGDKTRETCMYPHPTSYSSWFSHTALLVATSAIMPPFKHTFCKVENLTSLPWLFLFNMWARDPHRNHAQYLYRYARWIKIILCKARINWHHWNRIPSLLLQTLLYGGEKRQPEICLPLQARLLTSVSPHLGHFLCVGHMLMPHNSSPQVCLYLSGWSKVQLLSRIRMFHCSPCL